MTDVEPIWLATNQPAQFYRGGAEIAALRGLDNAASHGPEDWVGSTTTRFGQHTSGLSVLPDGRWLRDAVAADPETWLGPAHVREFADSTALLVKLLDAGQRLPVHFHPSDEFATRHFASHFGKTEAWVVIGASGSEPTVYAGFRTAHDLNTVHDWVTSQDSSAMLGALNRIPVTVGDTVYIPAGLPHAIGAGVFVVELQQPTDFSLTVEWRGFLAGPENGHLGLGFDTALRALDTSGWDAERLGSIVRRGQTPETGSVDLLPPASSRYFRANRLRPGTGRITCTPAFAVLVTLDGAGTLRTERGAECPLTKGSTYVVPYAAGETEVDGDVTTIRCLPPDPTEKVI